MADPTRPRVAILSTYFALLEQGMAAGFREARLDVASQLDRQVTAVADVVFRAMIDSADAAQVAAHALDGLDIDGIVIAPTMATPPDWVASAVRGRGDVPAILLAVRELDAVPDDYDTERGTSNSLLVGVTMLGNAFMREGRSMDLVMGTAGERAWLNELSECLTAAGAAATLRRATLLVGGAPIPGYSDVEVTPADLDRLGVRTVSFDDHALAAQMADVGEPERRGLVEWVASQGEIAVDDDILGRSVEVACALRTMAAEHGAVGGTFNCHGPVFRRSDSVGVTACLAVTALARDGRMFSCTGDIPVSIALILGRQLAGSALYCELYAVDRPGDWILVANGGEGDLSMSSPGTVRFLAEHHYEGARGAGVASAFDVALGPASLVSLSPLPGVTGGWRLIVLQGDVIGSRHRAMEGPNAMFRPLGGAAMARFEEWVRAGAPHHAALIPGRLAGALSRTCRYLGIDAMVIGEGPGPA